MNALITRSLTAFLGPAMDWKTTLSRLAHRPGYAIVAWIMLGLAVAANVVAFAILYGFMLKPLPYSQPGQLSVIRERDIKIGLNSNNALVSVKHYLALKKELPGIVGAGLATQPDAEPAQLAGQMHLLKFEEVTPSLFRTLGVQPSLGRWPAADADQPDGPPEVMISHHFWLGAYHGQPDVLSKFLEVQGRSFRIVGVMPAGFFYRVGQLDAWLPYVITPARAESTETNYSMVVRRGANVSQKQLDLELQNEQERLVEALPPDIRSFAEKAGFTLDAQSLRASELEMFGIGDLPWFLQAAAALLLLLALANTINLGLVRVHAHSHEFAMRYVLGATRTGLARLVLIEHLPIAVVVGVTALPLAWAGLRVINPDEIMPIPLLTPFKLQFGAPVIAFAVIFSTLAVLFAAVGPATLASSRRLLSKLGRSRTATGGRALRKVQRIFGATQIALACALLITTGLLSISLVRMLTQPLGFEPRHRIEATIILPHGVTNTTVWPNLEPALQRIPNVTSVAASGMTPYSRIGENHAFVHKLGESGDTETVNMPSVSADFFSTLGIEFIAGRAFTSAEVKNHTPVIVINEWLAKHFFGSPANAVGKTLDMWIPVRVVGVTRNIAWQPVPSEYKRGTVYFPLGENQPDLVVAILETRGPIAPMMQSIRRTIEVAVPGSAVFSMSTMPDVVRSASALSAAGVGIVTTFACLALLLAALGVFALTTFVARARLGEYGTRAALGAGPLALLGLGFREAAWLLIVGLPIGLIGAWLLGRAVASTLYQTPVLEPWLYIVGALLLIVVVFAAAWGPARRAARVPLRELFSGGTQ